MTVAFGPKTFHVAKKLLLLSSKEVSFIDLLDEVAATWPGLSFDDFRGGFILADTLLKYPEHIRPVAKGARAPGSDPVAWLDETIAITAPPRGSA